MSVSNIGQVTKVGFAQSTSCDTHSRSSKDFEEFFNSPTKPDDKLLKLATRKGYDEFQLPVKAKLCHLNDVFRHMELDIKNETPELAWKAVGYKKKKNKKGKEGTTRDEPKTLNKVKYFWHRVKAGEDIHPASCLAYGYSSSHGCPNGEKNYPATFTFGEAVFALQLIKGYQELDKGPIAYGHQGLGGMKNIYDRFNQYKYYTVINFQKFDKTLPKWLIHSAFAYMTSNIDFCHYNGYGIPDASRMFRMWTYIEDYVINTTIQTDNGLRWSKSNGLASGCYLTELIGSICNYILCQWICLKQTSAFAADVLVLGDESFIATPGDISLKEANNLMNSIGMKLNLNKSHVTQELQKVRFLGYKIGNENENN